MEIKLGTIAGGVIKTQQEKQYHDGKAYPGS